MIGKWKQLMDQKDRMLLRTRHVMADAARVLGKILDDDADAVLSAQEIGDVDGEETMDQTNTNQPEDRIEMLYRTACERISHLCEGRRTPEETRRFIDETLLMWGSRTPTSIRQNTFEYFRDPRRSYPDLPTMGTLANPAALAYYGEEMAIRLEKIRDIIHLIEALHREDPESDVSERVKNSRRRYEAILRQSETPIETIRRLAFDHAEKVSGVSANKIAEVFDRIDWSAIRAKRFERLEKLLFENVYEYLEREPRDPVEWRKWRDRQIANSQRRHHATEALRMVILIFENLRGEIAEQHRRRAAKSAEKRQLEAQLAQARLAAHKQVA